MSEGKLDEEDNTLVKGEDGFCHLSAAVNPNYIKGHTKYQTFCLAHLSELDGYLNNSNKFLVPSVLLIHY